MGCVSLIVVIFQRQREIPANVWSGHISAPDQKFKKIFLGTLFSQPLSDWSSECMYKISAS